MSVLMVPFDKQPWPTLGPLVCDFIEENLVFGPGDLRGQPAVVDDEKRALIWRMYEIYPQGHVSAGRRRFKRVGLSLAKGLAKTEFAAWIAACELHHEAPVRCIGFDKKGNPVGGPVTDPYIPLVAYTEEQSDELAYGALKAILEESPIRDDFDIGFERIMRRNGDGKAVSLSSSPSARDGARTTFQLADEPLALDTPIPTPKGWTTMGEVQPGDVVFGCDGNLCNVLGISEVKSGRPCYRVTFGDGSSIVADCGHLWRVYDHSPSYRCERTVTTEYIFNHKWSDSRRFTLVKPEPLELSDANLPLEPYFLGLWLGDGDSRNATVCVGKDDLEATESLIADTGYKVSRCNTKNNTPMLYVTLKDSNYSGWGATTGKPNNRSVVGKLRELELLTNKHIPTQYLRSSKSQRLALLQGLMDSDGCIDDKGRCTFVNTNLTIIKGVRELLQTLGYRPNTQTITTDMRWNTPREIYKIHFMANFNLPPFRLRRKREKVIERVQTNKPLSVATVEIVESVPVRCISVDSADHLFLAGESMMPTHNTHWWTSQKLIKAHQTMMANLPKRKLSDAWALEVTTAPELGAGSVAESTMDYARAIKEGRVKDARLFYFHRQASDDQDLETEEGARAAVIEASGPAAAWRDIDAIVELWRDPTTDRGYWERVWCNRLVKSCQKAFDTDKWKKLAAKENPVKDGDLITLGFDGAQFHDSTGLVATHIETGYQWVLGVWECPYGIENWQVPVEEVDDAVQAAFQRYNVWRMYADPPYWQSWLAKWAGEKGNDRVIEWWTNRRKAMSYALESYDTAITSGDISHSGEADLTRHIGNSYRHDLPQKDEETGKALWLIRKERKDSPHKIDLAMASVLSWAARKDAISMGAQNATSVYEKRGMRSLL